MAAPRDEVNDQVDRLFRKLHGPLVASLARIFGAGRLDLAESVVQDAFLTACAKWPVDGLPDNPSGWLVTVARNKAVDVVRSEQRLRSKSEDIARWYEMQLRVDEGRDVAADPTLLDDQLRLMFACCHPSLSRRAQVCLTLKVAAGFSDAEIARAVLSKEAAVRKLIYRAKRTLKAEGTPFAWPAPDQLPERLDAVLDTLYLIFNEGYGASSGDDWLQGELCDEAIRLCSLFVHDAFSAIEGRPRIYALLALMLLQSSRLPARTDGDGSVIVLADQDRKLWDRDRINLGLSCLLKSAAGDNISRFHLEAEIAACHATAADSESTDWIRIVELYDALLEFGPNAIVALNRAVAVGFALGPDAGLEALSPLRNDPALKENHLLPAAAAEFARRLDRRTDAAQLYRTALSLAQTRAEKQFLTKRMLECADR